MPEAGELGGTVATLIIGAASVIPEILKGRVMTPEDRATCSIVTVPQIRHTRHPYWKF